MAVCIVLVEDLTMMASKTALAEDVVAVLAVAAFKAAANLEPSALLGRSTPKVILKITRL